MFLKYVIVGKCVMKVRDFKLFSGIDLQRKNRVPEFKNKREGSSGLLERTRSCELY